MIVAIATLLVIIIGLAGAWLSVQVRSGWPWWLPVLAGLGSYTVWSATTKLTTTNLVVLSAWFDVVVCLAWFVGFWLLGRESISAVQWVGIMFLAVGLGLINWR